MFSTGALTTLSRASSRARASLRDLAAEARELGEDALDSDRFDEDELEPSQAREQVEEVYEPLMQRSGSSTPQRSRKRTRTSTGEEVEQEEEETLYSDEDGGFGEPQEPRPVRKLEVLLSYGIFFILGACILLPWNSEIVAAGYFGARLVGSSFEASFTSWMSLSFTSANLVFLAMANATQQGANLTLRILIAIAAIFAVIVLFIVSTGIPRIDTSLFFGCLIASTVLLSAAASYLQNAVVALSSKFGPMYLQGILSGQGAVGLAVAVLQFVSAYTATSPPAVLPLAGEAPEPDPAARASAFRFFLTIAVFTFVSFLAHLVLSRLPLYRLVIRGGEQEHGKEGRSRKASVRKVERKVRILGLSIFWVFAVTLSIFPSVTSSIKSVNSDKGGTGFFASLTQDALFIPLAFIVFAAGDWLGRAIPQVEYFSITNWRILAGASVARTAFVPLFLACNVQIPGVERSPKITSDIVYLLLMFLFAASNGYISTLIMLASVVEPSLESYEIDVAATILAFYLTSGLAVGSLISFPIRGSICDCNPFTM